MERQITENVLDTFIKNWANQMLRESAEAIRKGSKAINTYPRVFRLMRDRSDNPKARLGHVADGVEWTPGGKTTLLWKGPHVGFSTFDTMTALKAVHGYMNPITGMYDTRVVYVHKPKPLDKRLVEAVDHLYYTLSDYVGRAEKQAHVARTDLQAAFGRVQDLMVEGTSQDAVKLFYKTYSECSTPDQCA